MFNLKKKAYNQAEIYQKLMRYCAYQERCKSDVYQKMKGWDQGNEEIEEAINFLEEEGFIDELRYASSYVRGKFRSNKWGRNKIKEGLYAKRIEQKYIQSALLELNVEEYKDQLGAVLEKKNSHLQEIDLYKRKQKLALYAQSKGYELDLIWELVNKMNVNF